jgi:hypothetical protein
MRIIANHHRAARRLALAYVWILAASIALHGEVLPAGPRQVMPKLTSAEQDRLAVQFAPVLVFHPDEEYFPTSPLYPLNTERTAAPLSSLGTPESRIEAYRSLPLAEKEKLATVFYRAYPAVVSGESVVVLEYWFYYVQNDYRVRGNILPFWMDGSHANDLEHVHLLLRPATRDGSRFSIGPLPGDLNFSVKEAYASAHEGKIPANRYEYRSTAKEGPTHFLVELGSHALAPDIDEDGLFTPGEDGDSGSKVLWGIRDSGYTWPRYKTSYMTPRGDGNALVFSYAGRTPESDKEQNDRHLGYQLVPVESLMDRFAQLELTDKQLKHAFETEVFWFNRVFGKDNGRSDKLLVPPPAEIGTDSIGIRGVSSHERHFLAGTVLNVNDPGLFAGGRYSFLTRSRFLPDLMLQVDGIVTRKDKYLSPQVMLSYPIDGFTKIMAGQSMVTDSLTFDRVQWDWVGAIEVRLGDMRISAATRSVGPLRNSAKEFRLFYAF